MGKTVDLQPPKKKRPMACKATLWFGKRASLTLVPLGMEFPADENDYSSFPRSVCLEMGLLKAEAVIPEGWPKQMARVYLSEMAEAYLGRMKKALRQQRQTDEEMLAMAGNRDLLWSQFNFALNRQQAKGFLSKEKREEITKGYVNDPIVMERWDAYRARKRAKAEQYTRGERSDF